MHDHDADPLIVLQEKVAYLELQVGDLTARLDRELRESASLGERLDLLERALQVLAARSRTPTGEVQGAFTVDDPVPHSG